MTTHRMDHVGVVVEYLEGAIAFFVELGMELDGGTIPVEGHWVDRVVGLDDIRVEIAFVRTTQYEDIYRLCYLRGPAGIIVALAEELT